jgi:hypothetical protein
MNPFNDVVVLGRASEETKGSTGHGSDPGGNGTCFTKATGVC